MAYPLDNQVCFQGRRAYFQNWGPYMSVHISERYLWSWLMYLWRLPVQLSSLGVLYSYLCKLKLLDCIWFLEPWWIDLSLYGMVQLYLGTHFLSRCNLWLNPSMYCTPFIMGKRLRLMLSMLFFDLGRWRRPYFI